ncbi:MAG TPA: hypothetical protein DCG54_13775 [Anaerolineae bacterium]|jgi:hypothetical protein|nr:hypothetical protein [Anaerolineae bacterium]
MSQFCEQRLVEPIILKTARRRTALAFIGAITLALCMISLSACQSFQPDQPSPDQIELTTPTQTLSPTPPTSFIEPTPTLPSAVPGKFSYEHFSIEYPDSWVLVDMSDNEDFPLRERLAPLYGSGKVIALENDGLYLIIAIEAEHEGSSSGIFLTDQDYDKFVSDKDELVIQTTTFFLSRSHSSISNLLASHSGPYGWSALAEYIPEVVTQSGDVYRGYENVIRRNGFIYNFIVVSDEGGNTPSHLQQEMLDILKSVEW